MKSPLFDFTYDFQQRFMGGSMKITMCFVSLLLMSFAQAGEYTAASAYGSQYTCRDTGDGACAQSKITGQCFHQWDDEDGGMYACQLWTGEVKAKAIDKSSYKCKATTNGACAVKLTTGQCGPEWDNEDGGMYQCKKWTGELKVKPIDKSKYVCKKTTNGYCAQNTQTGQCFHQWTDKEHGNAKFQCQNWISN